MTIDEIRQFIQLVNESGIAELELQRGEDRVRIRRAPSAADIIVQSPTPVPLPASVPFSAPSNNSGAAPAPAAALSPAYSTDNSLLVKSPIVGTFYESPSPGSLPFVKVGDHVQPGQVLCIIESMKLMNEIEAEAAGIIAARLVENGHPVEYGEALFAMRPI